MSILLGFANRKSIYFRLSSELMLFILCIIPGLFFSSRSLQEPWTLFRLARANLSLGTNQIANYVVAAAGYRAEHIGGDILSAAWIGASFWSLDDLGLLPVGSLTLAILYFAASRTISKSIWIAFAISIYASWYYPRLYSQYATQLYVWTNILFLCFLILLISWIRQRTFVTSFLIIIVFIATFLHYHTTPLWIAVAMATSVFLLKLRNRIPVGEISSISWALPLFCAVLYFAFDTVVYGNALLRIKSNSIGESLFTSSYVKLFAPLFAREPEALPPHVIAQINPRVATWTTLLVLVILTLPAGVWCINKIYQSLRSKSWLSLVQHRDDIFIWVIIIVAISHALMYSMYGAISLRVIPLAFPLILPLVLEQFRPGPKIVRAIFMALAILPILGFISYAPTLKPEVTTRQTGVVSYIIDPKDRILSDPSIYGALLTAASEQDKVFDFVWPESKNYSYLVGDTSTTDNTFDYLIADKSAKPVTTSNWQFLEAWAKNLQSIDNNENLNKIYDSNSLIIYQNRGGDLPSYELKSTDIISAEHPFWQDFLLIFITFVILAFIPGAVIVVVLSNTGFMSYDEPIIVAGLSIGLSITIVTIIGYIINFSPLKLSLFAPIVALVSLCILGIYLASARSKLKWNTYWLNQSVLAVALILIWSLLATQVAHVRAQNGALSTEFFLTQNHENTDSLEMNIVNHKNESQTYKLTILANGEVISVLETKAVSSNTNWRQAWHIEDSTRGSKIQIVLDAENSQPLTLHLYNQDMGF
ncbi:MAG: hypothetical protein R3A44_24875 [Caldilineaceae bacterium]